MSWLVLELSRILERPLPRKTRYMVPKVRQVEGGMFLLKSSVSERDISGQRDKTRVPSYFYRSQCKYSKYIHALGKMVSREAYKKTVIGRWQLRSGPISLRITVGLLCRGILSGGAPFG
jgi:hypothetical protein